MNISCQQRVLLTGAGFTKNFGGPLAKEMWSIIYSSPELDKAPDVRELLRGDFDFESVYNHVVSGARSPFTEEPAQRQALRTAVARAYSYIDEKIRAFSNRRDAPNALNTHMVQEFIAKFAGTRSRPGFYFTLNQDLFVERHYYNGPRPTLPGVAHRSTWFTSITGRSLEDERCIVSRSVDNIQVDGNDFYYVKLHGSSNWYSSDQQTMVIGQAKEGQIAAEPLLSTYFEIFQSVLQAAKQLLCVGYSFSDPHINNAIRDGVKVGLSVYILSPESPDSLAVRLRAQGESGQIIWSGLTGYFQADLKTLFPVDQSSTAEWNMVKDRFFR